jgi:hypothetical protein
METTEEINLNRYPPMPADLAVLVQLARQAAHIHKGSNLCNSYSDNVTTAFRPRPAPSPRLIVRGRVLSRVVIVFSKWGA